MRLPGQSEPIIRSVSQTYGTIHPAGLFSDGLVDIPLLGRITAKPLGQGHICIKGWGCGCKGSDCLDLISSGKCGNDFKCAPTSEGPVCVCEY
jgi:hypothetical protein